MRNPDIILGPVITEKSIGGNQNGVYVFKVDKKATKTYKKAIVTLAQGSSIEM